MLMRILPLALSLAFGATTLQAQSSLGVQGFSAELAYGATDTDQTTLSGLAQLDVRVTDVHGLQLDFGLVDRGSVMLGQMGAHLYMRPAENQKYGLFAMVADVDEFSVQYMNAGLEARLGLSDATAAEFQFGIGGTTAMGGRVGSQWDYAFVGAGVLHEFGDTMTLEARADVTEFDESAFSAIGLDTRLRLSHSARGSNFEMFAELRNSALFGQDAAKPITTLVR